MNLTRKRKLVAGAVAGALAAGAGGAIAANQLGSGGADSQAIVNDAAKQLGIDPGKLSDALKKALENQVDSLVAAGRLTKEQGDALKARIESGQAPLFGGRLGGPGGPDHGFGFRAHRGFADLDAAAAHLGVSASDLRTALEGGKTLAQVAQEHGKSVDGLVSALLDAAKQKLDAGVKAGRLTQAQEDTILSGLKQRFTDLVNGKRGGLPHFGQGRGFRFDGPDHLFRRGPDRGPTA